VELKINFASLNDEKQAWDDLHRLTQDNDEYVRRHAADALGACYSHVPEGYKKQAWDDLIRLTQDKAEYVRWGAANSLGACYFHVPEGYKKQAWDDLLMLIQDKDDYVQRHAADALGACYSHVSEEYKKQAWDDLIRFIQDNDESVRRYAVNSLGACYSHVPEEYKKQAWDDLHRLTQDKRKAIESQSAIELFGLGLVQDEDEPMRRHAADALGACYSHVPEGYKKQAWDDLHRLTQDNDEYVRKGAANSLGACYSHIPEEYKKQAWDDLIKLTQDKDDSVRSEAIYSLGACYSHIPEEYKEQAWDNLHKFTQDKDMTIRIAANHSSGRISIYRASQAKSEEIVRKELETALSFFKESSNESTYFNPAKFCLPFYRSFYTITFGKEDAGVEVKKYLADAKSAVKGSKSKEKLLDVVENLGNALKVTQRVWDLNDVKCDLNAYRLYCERAADMLNEVEDKAPGATQLVRKGLPIIDKRIKQTLAEIQQRANTVCKQSKGTPTEEIACKINQEVQKWQISDQEQMTQNVNNLIFILKAKIRHSSIF